MILPCILKLYGIFLIFCLENGFDVLNLDYSPIKGPEGNIEYLIHLRKSDDPKSYTEITPEELVKNSHSQLDK